MFVGADAVGGGMRDLTSFLSLCRDLYILSVVFMSTEKATGLCPFSYSEHKGTLKSFHCL